jgi:hypothetical protein
MHCHDTMLDATEKLQRIFTREVLTAGSIEVVLFEVAGKLATVSLGDGIPRILKYFIDFP